MHLEITIEDDRWRNAGLAGLARTAVRAVLQRLQLPSERFEISILGCDDLRIAALNADFRGKPGATNVLSWPTEDLGAGAPGAVPRLPGQAELGDIAIAYDICARQAAAQGKAFSGHVTHLLVHATLHLLGYDHINAQDAACMERFEVEILAKLGVADPY